MTKIAIAIYFSPILVIVAAFSAYAMHHLGEYTREGKAEVQRVS